MKQKGKIIWQYGPWLLLCLGIDVFAALLLWLADVQAFYSLAGVIVLGTVLLFLGLCGILIFQERKREQAFLDFLENPDECREEKLLRRVSPGQRTFVRLLGGNLREMQQRYAQLQGELNDYEEYVESWAHEIKTPLSLLTFLLDNRREELPEGVDFRLEYIRNHMQESVDQMLFYARIKGGRKDYLFEYLDVRGCIEEVLEDYRPLLEEKAFQISCALPECSVYTDRRGLHFLLGQLVSNAVKYSGEDPRLDFAFVQEEQAGILSIRDNGIGVRSCDQPYIFEKGFTGDSGEGRKRATGMGLYLVREIAGELNLSLEVRTAWGEGFEIRISFPTVQRNRVF